LKYYIATDYLTNKTYLVDKNWEKVAAIFLKWNRSDLLGQKVADQYVEFLINKLRSGDLPNGTQLPRRSQLYSNNNISYYALDKAFKKMSMEGFLFMRSGQRPIAQYPPKIGHRFVHDVKVEGNYHCKPIRLHMNKPHKLYQKDKDSYLLNLSPVKENSISYELLDFSAVKYNQLYNSGFLTDNFYYSHDMRCMLQAVLMSVYQPGQVIVIPANTFSELPAILQLLRWEYSEIDTDKEGFNVDALTDLCKQHKVAAVFLMSRANYPTTVHTTEKRIKELFSLREKNDFKIVEIDFFLPWLEQKVNPLLKLAGTSREHVIYLYPHTFLLKELSEVVVVSASAQLRQKIKGNLKLIGAKAFRSIAEAMRNVMGTKEFLLAEQKIATLVQKHKMLLKEVFMASGFWQSEGLVYDAGVAIFLRPLHSTFPKDSYALLKDQGILAVNPEYYSGSSEYGLRFDFSYYIGHHDFEKKIKLVESECRSICTIRG
jgi:hypothetical protein